MLSALHVNCIFIARPKFTFIDTLSIEISRQKIAKRQKAFLYLPYVDVGEDVVFQASSQRKFL